MEARIVDLRYRMKSVLEALDRGETVTILHRGKPRAQLTPIMGKAKAGVPKATDHPFFGMWKDRKDMEDVNAYVRKIRKSRIADL
jgi:antitoxin (DNA-binding transcriptional repressor) of toxin-antitoxin stability system